MPRMAPVYASANPPRAPEKPHQKANSNRSPRLVHVLRRPANTGENPRKRCASWDGVRLYSRLFDGLETANGPQRARKGTANDRSAPSTPGQRGNEVPLRLGGLRHHSPSPATQAPLPAPRGTKLATTEETMQ
jgi:hypothetical protein